MRHPLPRCLLPAFAAYGVTALLLLPILWMVRTAFEETGAMAGGGLSLLPSPFTLDNMAAVLEPLMLQRLANSLIVALCSTLLALAVALPAAYALSRGGFPRKLDKLFLFLVLILKLTPPISLAIPLYQILIQLALLDTLAGLVLVHQLYALPFAIWMLLGFVRDVPLAYEEAIMIDGANLWDRLTKVILPLTAPGIAATAVFLAILSWNEFLYALLFIQSPDNFTLPVFISTLITEDHVLWGELSAIGLLASLPVFALVTVVQRALTTGFSGGLK